LNIFTTNVFIGVSFWKRKLEDQRGPAIPTDAFQFLYSGGGSMRVFPSECFAASNPPLACDPF
jgi:hypothetical protein